MEHAFRELAIKLLVKEARTPVDSVRGLSVTSAGSSGAGVDRAEESGVHYRERQEPQASDWEEDDSGINTSDVLLSNLQLGVARLEEQDTMNSGGPELCDV